MAPELTTSSAIFGRIMAAMRGERSVTQRELRRLTGLPTGSIERLELGLATATIEHLRVLAAWWGCTCDELLALLDECETSVRAAGVPVVARRSSIDNAQLDRMIAAPLASWLGHGQLALLP